MTVRDPMDLTCKEVVELVTELLSDALTVEDRVRLEQHLLVCPPCTLHVGQVRATIELAGRLRSQETPVATDSPLMDVFRRWRHK